MSPLRVEMVHDVIIRVITRLLLPCILIFALYVQFHGEYSPGGGFQAGVIFSTGIILYALVFGFDAAVRVIPLRVLETLVSLGVLIYGAVGILGILRGGAFLEYGVLAHDPQHGQHLGILLIEVGVGITVAAAMTLVFFAFINREGDP